MKHLKGIVESPTAPNTTDVLWLDADGGLKAFKNGGWKALVEKGSGGNSGGNSGNTAEPNIIYETDVMMYDYAAIQPKIEQGENLVKTDNLDNAFVKLNLILAEKGKFNSVLIPVQHSLFPIFDAQSTTMNMLTGRYDVIYNVEAQIRLTINISIAYLGGLNVVAIEPVKTNVVYIDFNGWLYSLEEQTYKLENTSFITNLKTNQFSEIYIKEREGSRIVRLNNIIYHGDENDINSVDGHDITGSYVFSNYLFRVRIQMYPSSEPTITITAYPLTSNT